jgi:uncharacterized SAM-binding protein YcdF (DUF218 family)
MSGRRRWVVGVIIAVATLTAFVTVLHRPLLSRVAALLVVQDGLAHSDAIVVMAGGTPSREARAATLFREGWAPRVIISRPFITSGIRELVALGVRPLDLQGESRLALVKYGVPADRITAIGDAARTTEPELRLVHQAARADGYRRVILVTSPQHTRRVKVIWARESRESHIEGILVAAATEEFTVDDWWRQRRAAEALLHEYLGLLALYLGISPLMR